MDCVRGGTLPFVLDPIPVLNAAHSAAECNADEIRTKFNYARGRPTLSSFDLLYLIYVPDPFLKYLSVSSTRYQHCRVVIQIST